MEKQEGFTRGSQLANSRFYMGNLMSFLLNGVETNGRFAIVDGIGRIGNEPPPHSHDWEDEIYYVLEGEAELFIEGQAGSLYAKPGDVVFLPQGKAHAIYFRSEPFRTLLMASATSDHSVGLDAYFREISEPAASMSLPTDTATYAAGTPTEAFKAAERHGVHFLTPDETKLRLPSFPGFGANLKQS